MDGDDWHELRRRRMPNVARARIDPLKLRDYVLSPKHEVGRYKAAFFRSLGYSLHGWRLLEADLRRQHLTRLASECIATPYGRKFVVRASLEGPARSTPVVVSVWIVLTGEDFPRFVTVYPGD